MSFTNGFIGLTPESMWEILSDMDEEMRNLTLEAILHILNDAVKYVDDLKETRKQADALKDMLATSVGVVGGTLVITKSDYLKDYRLSKKNSSDNESVTLTAKAKR